MADVNFIKDIATIAAPLTKTLIELWLKPKLDKVGEKWLRNKNKQDHFFNNKFEEYLNEKFKNYSILNILAFRNQQRKIKDLYLPLTISSFKNGKKLYNYTIEEYKDDLIPTYKKVLLTDTAGMGKSTISKILFLSVIEKNKGIPIFIELRRLNKNNKVIDEIFNELKLINEEVDKKFILDLVKRGDFIFFLDGYDEVATIDKKYVTEDLQKFIHDANKNFFLLTSRPDESLASFGNFQDFSINPLKQDEAYKLLTKYDENGELSTSLVKKLKEESYINIKEFLTNPLLVSLLFTAFEYKQTIPLKKHLFYRQVYDAIFESHDLTKGDYFIRDKHSKLSTDDFHTILRCIGFICLKLDKIEFSKDEILSIISQANTQCEVIEFEESKFLLDLISTVPIFNKEGLYYKWTHKSLYEYFAAQFIYLDSKDEQQNILKSLIRKKDSLKYFNVFDIYSNIDYKSFRNIVVYEVVKEFINYCENSYQRFNLTQKHIIERQELTYDAEMILIQIEGIKEDSKNKKIDTFDSETDYCFELIQKKRKEENFGVRVVKEALDKIEYLNGTYVLERTKENVKHGNISFILKKRGEELVKVISEESDFNFKEFNIKKNEILSIDDRSNNIINEERYFNEINKVLRVYKREDIIFDYATCKKFISKIETSQNKNNESNFLKI